MIPGTLAEGIESAILQWPDRVAVSHGERSLTYAQLGSAIAALSAGYRRLGIVNGDRVVCQLPNCPELIIAMAASWSSGAIHVAADTDLTGPELVDLVARADGLAVIVDPGPDSADPWATGRAIRQSLPHVMIVVVGSNTGAPEGAIRFDDLVNLGDDDEGSVRPKPDDDAMILFTSGTTGQPKGAVGQHGVLADGWRWIADELGCGPDDVHLAHLPLAHGFGIMMAAAGLFSGGRLVLVERFSPSEILEVVARERITVLNGTPAHFHLLLDRLDRARHDVTSLRTGVGSAATFSPRLLRRIFDDLGMGLLLLYGSSEGFYVATTDRDAMLAGSVGRVEAEWVSVVDGERKPLPTGQIGEIAFRSWLTQRYWDQHQSAGSSPGQWYYTGDVGKVDEQGLLYVLGRIKHQINRGGQKIDPGEVDAALSRHPGLKDHAVLGTPDPVLGEIVCACVVPATGEAVSLADLRAFLAASLARHKLPEELRLVGAIPRTSLGKVDISSLRQAAMEASTVERLRRSAPTADAGG